MALNGDDSGVCAMKGGKVGEAGMGWGCCELLVWMAQGKGSTRLHRRHY